MASTLHSQHESTLHLRKNVGRTQSKIPVKHDKRRYKRRNRIEIMFGRLKDWPRIATRYDRCPKVFLSPIVLAATDIYWLCVLSLAV
uniref:transposase n=1 Tax=Rhodovulum sulfidophilum TaxID=35806 RepID=UPI002DD427A0|nr:transposase [Rhodovulum sulfidophilum]